MPTSEIRIKKKTVESKILTDIVSSQRNVPVPFNDTATPAIYTIQFGRYKGRLGYFVIDTSSLSGRVVTAKWYRTSAIAARKMPAEQPFEIVNPEGNQWILAAKKCKVKKVECLLIEE